MPTNTYTPLATVTLTGTDSEVVFSNIGSGYRDLILVCSMLGTGGDGVVRVRFNSDTGTNYHNVFAYGEAPSTTGSISSNISYAYGSITNAGTSIATLATIQLQDYSVTDKHKTMLIKSGYGTNNAWIGASRWANTNAITSISLSHNGTNSFASGSTFNLFGVVA
jgi:hypothetical protein